MLTPGGAAPVFSPQDTQDPNPLIRALAVRTMGCIRVDKIVEYLCEPLRKCLKDEDPYVRKTAAVCVAKLYDINGELVEVMPFIAATLLCRCRTLLCLPLPRFPSRQGAPARASLSQTAGAAHLAQTPLRPPPCCVRAPPISYYAPRQKWLPRPVWCSRGSRHL